MGLRKHLQGFLGKAHIRPFAYQTLKGASKYPFITIFAALFPPRLRFRRFT